MYQNIATKVLTGVVRLSYANLVTPFASKQGDEPKYSVTLLIPKTDAATKLDIEASMKAAYDEGVTNKWGGAHPQMNQLLWDGDGLRKSGLPFGDECKGHWVITAASKQKPQVVSIDNINCELAPNDIYSGMYARVTINFFSFDTNGNKGVGCGLGNVMKVSDGEPLAGGASAASDFADVGNSVMPAQPFANTAATAPAYAPTAPAYPQPAVPPTAYPQPNQSYPAPAQAMPAVNNVPPTNMNPITGLPY